MHHAGQRPLPYYGLDRSFTGERRVKGAGWDINAVAHRPAGHDGEINIGVIRRHLAGSGVQSRAQTSPDVAREDVAMELALASGVEPVDNDLSEIARELADSDWRPTTIEVDREQVTAHEYTYDDTWAIEHINDEIILYIVGPTVLRPKHLAVVRMPPQELGVDE
jgi:hypothetical protein